MYEYAQLRPLSFLMVLVLGIVTLGVLVFEGGWCAPMSREKRVDDAQLMEVLLITDLALWTEARYTRHPSQADCFTPFQTAPAAMDHFLSGMWVPPAVQQQQLGRDKPAQR